MNPNGHIPAIDDDGLVLNESLAINLYLAKKHGGPLGPRQSGRGRTDDACGRCGRRSRSSRTPSRCSIIASPSKPEERDPKIAAAAIEALRAPFAVLDKALAATGYIVGGRFTVADINTAEVFRYAMPAPELFEAAPRVKAWLAACHARPAFKSMMADAREGAGVIA